MAISQEVKNKLANDIAEAVIDKLKTTSLLGGKTTEFRREFRNSIHLRHAAEDVLKIADNKPAPTLASTEESIAKKIANIIPQGTASTPLRKAAIRDCTKAMMTALVDVLLENPDIAERVALVANERGEPSRLSTLKSEAEHLRTDHLNELSPITVLNMGHQALRPRQQSSHNGR